MANADCSLSFVCENIKYRKYRSLAHQLSNLIIQRRREEDENNIDLGPGRLQLWTEAVDEEREVCESNGPEPIIELCLHVDQAVRQNSLHSPQSPDRPVRMQPYLQPGYRFAPPRRVVIFIPKLRVIISIPSKPFRTVTFHYLCSPPGPVDKNWHVEAQDMGNPHILRFVPRSPSRDPSFVASMLRPAYLDDKSSFPGIPLSTKLLRRLELQQGNAFECDLIELTLRTDEIRNTLATEFADMRRNWQQETRNLEARPGYAPIPHSMDPVLGTRLQPPPRASRPPLSLPSRPSFPLVAPPPDQRVRLIPPSRVASESGETTPQTTSPSEHSSRPGFWRSFREFVANPDPQGPAHTGGGRGGTRRPRQITLPGTTL
jgi:hypothetical protein